LLEIARQFDDDAMHEFLDGLVSGKVLPKTKKRVEPASTPSVPKTSPTSDAFGHTFNFTGSQPDFELTIRFANDEAPSRPEILRALKAAFDAVKNESSKI
ncbi:MAG TPA: hypothetical protein VFZ49_00170, partial [Pyrinomonadaceae bacterium]